MKATIRYGIGRVLTAIVLLVCIVSFNFILVRLMPGDPLRNILGEEDFYRLSNTNPALLEELRVYYGLDGSLWEQYCRYIQNMSHLDFGYSYKNDLPVLQEIAVNAKWTLILLIPTLVIGAFAGGYLGLKAGWKNGGIADRILTPLALFFKTVPGNCLAILFLMIFAFKLKLFPIAGMVSGGHLTGMKRFVSILHHMALPMSVLLLYRIASNFLLMKSTVAQIRDAEYTVTAFSKGLTERQVIRRHVLKNALAPYITALCMQMGGLLGGATFIEIVFSWRGMGLLYYNAMGVRDFPVLQCCFLISGSCVILSNLLADLFTAIIDPRVRGGAAHE